MNSVLSIIFIYIAITCVITGLYFSIKFGDFLYEKDPNIPDSYFGLMILVVSLLSSIIGPIYVPYLLYSTFKRDFPKFKESLKKLIA